MSIVKTKTKMKSGTIAIIALSIVLVLSLVTTITLAYFTATRNVITTVQFANGVTLQMTGVKTKTNNAVDTPPSNSTDNLYWVADYTDTTGDVHVDNNNGDANEPYGGYENVNAQLTFEEMKVRVVDSDAYVALKLVVTITKGGSDVTSQYTGQSPAKAGYTEPTIDTTNWTADTNHTGWMIYNGGSGSDTNLMSHADVTMSNYTTSPYDTAGYKTIVASGYTLPNSQANVNNFAGCTVTYTLNIIASDTLPGLMNEISTFDPSSVVSQGG